MTVLTEGRHTAEYILSEANGFRSREVGTLLAGNNLTPGTVLARITASGKLTVLTPGASDGSQTAFGVLYDSVNATGADKPAVYTARDAEVKALALTWPAGISAPNKTAAITALAALGIIVR